MTSAIPCTLPCKLLYAGGHALAKLLAGSLGPVGTTFLRSALVLPTRPASRLVNQGRRGAWITA
jgi:hypothetical protein